MAARPVHILSSVSGLFQAVKTALPETQVININLPEANSPELGNEEKRKLSEAEVLLADLVPIVQYNLLNQLPRLKWLQSTYAGVDRIMKCVDQSKPPAFTLTRVHGVFGRHMAEFTISHIIAHERKFSAMMQDQRARKWNKDVYQNYRTLSELTLGILGFGDIGKEVAKAARVFGMKVWGMGSREGTPRTPCTDIQEYRGLSGLSELLENCDYVCSVLPDTPQTTDILSGDVLSHCKHKKSVFINIGRGNVIDESSILRALSNGWISAAILDVFREEPLPVESALWEHPDVIITPHVSAITMFQEMKDVFVDNYQRYTAGEDMQAVVKWDRGY